MAPTKWQSNKHPISVGHATGVLEQLYGYDRDVNDYDRPYGDGDVDQVVAFQRIKTKIEILNDDGEENGDDDAMSFCNVGFVWDQVEEEDEDWCLVWEIWSLYSILCLFDSIYWLV